MKIRMKIRMILKLIRNYFIDCKEFSFSVANGKLYLNFSFVPWEKRRMHYEKTILSYLENNYQYVINQCISDNKSIIANIEKKHIWIMWWQGEDKMPPLVSKCYKQLNNLAGTEVDVVLITESNWMNYVNIPEYILEKVNKKEITITQLSDIIRSLLLSTWGGFWIDAAIYVNKMPDHILDYDLYTLHAPGMFPEFLSRGNWIPGLFYAKERKSLLFVCLSSLFLEYWKKQNVLIDYLLVDYFISIIIKHDEKTRKLIDMVPENREFYNLRLKMNEEYSEEEYNRIVGSSPFHALTYKNKLIEMTDHGEITNYGYFMKN